MSFAPTNRASGNSARRLISPARDSGDRIRPRPPCLVPLGRQRVWQQAVREPYRRPPRPACRRSDFAAENGLQIAPGILTIPPLASREVSWGPQGGVECRLRPRAAAQPKLANGEGLGPLLLPEGFLKVDQPRRSRELPRLCQRAARRRRHSHARREKPPTIFMLARSSATSRSRSRVENPSRTRASREETIGLRGMRIRKPGLEHLIRRPMGRKATRSSRTPIST